MYSNKFDRTISTGISFSTGALPFGTGHKVTPVSVSNHSSFDSNLLPPFIDGSSDPPPSEDGFALPFGYNPVPVTTIDPLYDEIFNLGEQSMCPSHFKKQRDHSDKTFIELSHELDSIRASLDRDFPIETLKGYQDFDKAKEWDTFHVGIVSNEFRCSKAYTGLCDPKGEISKKYFWKFQYGFQILMMNYWLSLPESHLFWTDGFSKSLIESMENRIYRRKKEGDNRK